MKSIGIGHFKTDFKRLVREPVFFLFLFIPLLIIGAIKLFIIYGVPVLQRLTGFNITPWYGYIMTGVVLIAPCMLGAVSGFIMIDDRDERITELMSVTPLGFSGYMINRFSMPFIMSIFYTVLGYFLLGFFYLEPYKLLLCAIMAGMQSIIISLLLYILADNKVKGLTYAKGLSGLIITAFSDLSGIPWLSFLSSCLPFYWTSSVIIKPFSIATVILGLIVNGAWLFIVLRKAIKN